MLNPTSGPFPYAEDLINYVEYNQCVTCAFSKLVDDPNNEFPMCHEIEAQILLESPVEALDKTPDGGVVCTAYKNVILVELEHPDQGRLF
jgi:hypothetical protein